MDIFWENAEFKGTDPLEFPLSPLSFMVPCCIADDDGVVDGNGDNACSVVDDDDEDDERNDEEAILGDWRTSPSSLLFSFPLSSGTIPGSPPQTIDFRGRENPK